MKMVIPFNEALGLKVGEFVGGTATMRLPYRPELSDGDGTLAVEALVALADAACGAAVFSGLEERGAVATVDLRYDFLAAPPAGAEVCATARCEAPGDGVVRVLCDVTGPSGEAVGRAIATFVRDAPSRLV